MEAATIALQTLNMARPPTSGLPTNGSRVLWQIKYFLILIYEVCYKKADKSTILSEKGL